MNHVVLVGDLTGDIYYDQFLMKGKETPFLRLVLMTNKPYLIRGLRAVLYGESARLYYPYLAKGSKVAAIGQLVSRKHKGTTYHEVNTQQLVLLRNINWDAGERERQRNNLPTVSDQTNKAFLVGEITGDIFYSWFPTGQDGRLYAFMRMFLTVQSPGHDRIERLRVVVRGTLAEIAYPYLATGSKVAVDGHLQTSVR